MKFHISHKPKVAWKTCHLHSSQEPQKFVRGLVLWYHKSSTNTTALRAALVHGDQTQYSWLQGLSHIGLNVYIAIINSTSVTDKCTESSNCKITCLALRCSAASTLVYLQTFELLNKAASLNKIT